MALIGCNINPLSNDISTNEDTNQYSDYWFNNSPDFDSIRMNKLTNNAWLLFETQIVPDSIEVIDLSNTIGLYFPIDTSKANRIVLRFHPDFTITEVTTHRNGKWTIIHKKNINVQWDEPIKQDMSGQYSISYLKNQRLHLFRGSHKQKTKTKHIFRQINYW